MNKINDQELENVAGGANRAGVWVNVCRLQSGYLALRTAPCYGLPDDYLWGDYCSVGVYDDRGGAGSKKAI